MTNFSDLCVSKTSAADVSAPGASALMARRAGPLVAVAAAMLMAACSTAPDWTKPSTISDSITGASPSEPTNETVAAQQAAAEASSEDASFPSAGSVPQVPQTGNYAGKQDLANSLVADRQHARYSGEALRGGTEPPASPLPSRRAAALPELPEVEAEVSVAADNAGRVIPEREVPAYRAPTRRMGSMDTYGDEDAGEAEAVAEAVTETAPEPVAQAETAAPDVEIATLPAPAKPAPAAPAAAPAPVASAAPVASTPVAAAPAPAAASAPVKVATTAPARRAAVPAKAVPTFVAEADAARELRSNAPAAAPVGMASAPVSTPAPPAVARTPVAAAPATYVSGQPQFAASTAPPLPTEVMDQVPAVVSARFEETRSGSASASAGVSPNPQPTAAGDGIVIDYSAIGAGSPVPDLEQGSSSVLPLTNYERLTASGAEGGPFAPVALYFGHGSSRLSADDKAQIAEIAGLQAKRGGGAVRVVGHASSRTSNLPVESHLMANFDMSMTRANIVAAELMRHGVAASDMIIEAVGDRTPVFYESMPAGEAGNRRAEIFLE